MSVVGRAIEVAWIFLGWPVALAARALTSDPGVPIAVDRLAGRTLAQTLERLGAAFIKVGQVLSTRPDLVPPAIAMELGRLRDRVAPVPFDEVEAVLVATWGAATRATIHVEHAPSGTGSIAQVHRATLPDGTPVAVKVRRPRATEEIGTDLAVLRALGRLLSRIEALAFLAPADAIETFAKALETQLDLDAERAHAARFRAAFRRERGVTFPRSFDALSSDGVHVMEWVDGVPTSDPSILALDEAAKIDLAERGARAILKMVFEDRYVHADLHPGNVWRRRDGELVFLDTGLVTEIPRTLVKPWIETFAALAARDARKAAELFYVYAPSTTLSDYDAYEREVVTHLDRLFGATLADIDVLPTIYGMMSVLRRHGVGVQQAYAVVHVALLVAEGLGKMLDPTIDLVALSIPFLIAARMDAPEGTPLRRVPRGLGG